MYLHLLLAIAGITYAIIRTELMAWSERFKYGKPNNTDEKQIGIRY